jgi:hypothetical protein
VGKTPKPYTRESNRIPESPNQDGSTTRNSDASRDPSPTSRQARESEPTLIPQGKQHTAIVAGGRLGSGSPATATATSAQRGSRWRGATAAMLLRLRSIRSAAARRGGGGDDDVFEGTSVETGDGETRHCLSDGNGRACGSWAVAHICGGQTSSPKSLDRPMRA